MSVVADFADLLPLVVPAVAEGYLRSSGWRVIDEAAEIYKLWGRSDDNGSREVFLPLNRSFRDYTQRVLEMARALADFEARSIDRVVTDIIAGPYDVVRLRASAADSATGSVPLSGGVAFFQGVKDLLLAAGCAAVDKRAYYLTNKPGPASELIRESRLGQTERGSFVVTIYVPVPIETQATPGLFVGAEREPFARRTTKTLLMAVGAACGAARASAQGGGAADLFRRAIKSGVSANLCEALAGIHEGTQAESVEVGVRWAYTVPAPIGIPPVTVRADYVPVFREACRRYRAKEEPHASVITGSVVRLQRDQDDALGLVTVRANFGDKTQLVKMQLTGDDYHNAVDAHDKKLPIMVEGTLVREGRYCALLAPVEFRVISQLRLS